MDKLPVCQQMTFVSNQMRRPDSGPGRIALDITGALLRCPRDARCPGQRTAVQGRHPLGGQTAWAVLSSGLRQACHRPSLCCLGPSTAVVATWSPEGGRSCSCASAASGGSSIEGLGGGRGDPFPEGSGESFTATVRAPGWWGPWWCWLRFLFPETGGLPATLIRGPPSVLGVSESQELVLSLGLTIVREVLASGRAGGPSWGPGAVAWVWLR